MRGRGRVATGGGVVVRSLLPLLLSIFKKRLLAKNSCLLMHLESPLVLTSSVRGSGVTVSMGASVSETAGRSKTATFVCERPSVACERRSAIYIIHTKLIGSTQVLQIPRALQIRNFANDTQRSITLLLVADSFA